MSRHKAHMKARKKAAKAARQGQGKAGPQKPSEANQRADMAAVDAPEQPSVLRPTPEQTKRAAYVMPKGPERAERPAVNTETDAIARLMLPPAKLTPEQHDAARDWQELRHAVRAELGIAPGRSCLDITIKGHDGGDGDVELAARWRRVQAELGPARAIRMDWTCVHDHKPRDMPAFLEALDAFADAITGRTADRRKRA